MLKSSPFQTYIEKIPILTPFLKKTTLLPFFGLILKFILSLGTFFNFWYFFTIFEIRTVKKCKCVGEFFGKKFENFRKNDKGDTPFYQIVPKKCCF